MAFLNSLSSILEAMPKVSLLVLNSLSFPLSNLPNPRTKPGILEHIKQVFTKAAVMKNLTVRYSAASDLILRVNRTQQIVTTSQLATKVLKDDGSPGNLAEGGRIMVVPQLGDPLNLLSDIPVSNRCCRFFIFAISPFPPHPPFLEQSCLWVRARSGTILSSTLLLHLIE